MLQPEHGLEFPDPVSPSKIREMDAYRVLPGLCQGSMNKMELHDDFCG